MYRNFNHCSSKGIPFPATNQTLISYKVYISPTR